VTLTAATTACIATHRATLQSDADAADAFERFVLDPVRFGRHRERQEQLQSVLVLGAAMVPSLVVLTAALLGGVPIDQILDPRGRTLESIGWHHGELLRALNRKRPVLTVDDLAALFELAPHASFRRDDILKVATLAAERLDAAQVAALHPQLAVALADAKDPRASTIARSLRPRLRALLPASEVHTTGVVDTSVITLGDGWSVAVVGQLLNLEGDNVVITDALEHLATATTGTAPTKKWRTQWDEIVARGDDAETVARIFVDALLEATPIETVGGMWGGRNKMVLTPNNSDLARGGVWAVARDHSDDTASLLGEVALVSHNENVRTGFAQGEKVTNACVTMLGTMHTPAAITELRLLRDGIKHQGVRKQVVKALLAAARASGLRTTRLADGSVPTFGLDATGTKTVPIVSALVRVSAHAGAKPQVEWFPDADDSTDLGERKAVRAAPPDIVDAHPEAVAALKAEVKELTKVVTAERARLETVIGEDDPWPFSAWAEHYWYHPVTGSFARTLAWRVTPNDPPGDAATAAPFEEVATGPTPHDTTGDVATATGRWSAELAEEAATGPAPHDTLAHSPTVANGCGSSAPAEEAGAGLAPHAAYEASFDPGVAPGQNGAAASTVRVAADDSSFVGFALEEPTTWIDAAGVTRTVDPATATVRPWHPVRSTPDEIRALRAVLTEHEIRQPFKQAFREVYLLTPAEEETAVYSNRFAAHILRYQQTYALMKTRGWVTNYLGSWESGSAGCAKRSFDDDGVTAHFFHDPANVDETERYGRVELCVTDQVRFIRTGDRGAVPLPLVDIDPVVLSETMRDVDLFVAVCSIGNDPEWTDRGEQRHGDYWQHYAFGELGSSAEVRRDALAQILPKLKIAAQCELDDRNLVVHGQLGTYRIHLGSGNVMMDPSRYLCIVAGRGGAKTSKVFLPFEDDHLLTVILSKAFLLAADTKITDKTILQQMGVTT